MGPWPGTVAWGCGLRPWLEAVGRGLGSQSFTLALGLGFGLSVALGLELWALRLSSGLCLQAVASVRGLDP